MSFHQSLMQIRQFLPMTAMLISMPACSARLPSFLVADEITTIKAKSAVKQQIQRGKLIPIDSSQIKPDVSDTPDIPLVDHDLDVKRDALRSFNVAEYLKHIPQIQTTCGEIVQEIYNDKEARFAKRWQVWQRFTRRHILKNKTKSIY